MTPDHASPEQVRGQVITTASDVYVLGVLLYKLLAGIGPYVIPSMRLTDIERAICEKAPPLPSHAVGGDDSAAGRAVAEARGTTPGRLRRTLQGDLDNIVCMAMRKEPERRYGSAQQLAGDIQRYLDGKPVLARSDTLSYRSSKFIRRHWLPVAAGASVFALILAFAVTTYVQSLRIAAERDRVARAARGGGTRAGARRRGIELPGESVQAVGPRSEPRQSGHRARAPGFEHQAAPRGAAAISRPPRQRCSRRWARYTTASASTRRRCRF